VANVPLSFASLAELDDGRLAAAFDRELRAAEADLRDRPADDRKRKIVLTLELEPLQHKGDFDGAEIDYYITSKKPHEQGNTIRATPKRIDGKWTLLMPTLGTDANQNTMPFERDDDA
jgi:hypothetical protein